MTTPLQYAESHHDQFLSELKQFLRIPSVSTQPDHKEDVRRAATWLADAMSAAGLDNVEVFATEGHPLVYADWLNAGPTAPTVLIYGHYDVQPGEPFAKWETPPFEPTVHGDYIYARGASDDKGQLYTHVKAVEAYVRTNGRLPVNVKFIVEGEEEIGGASLTKFIPEHTDLLAADVALISDTAMVSTTQPAIVYGLRGLCYMLLDVTGPGRDLHSGGFGGGIDNPINVLSYIIARLRDENGRVLIPGFYDKVRSITEAERDLLSRFPLDKVAWLEETGAPQIWGEPGYTLVERLGARPTLDVNGIIGGYTGPGAKTVLPSTVHAKISMRLVPDQDPEEIAALFREYVQQLAPRTVRLDVTKVHGAHPNITDLEIPAMKAAVSAYEQTFAKRPVFMREGGSIPVVSDLRRNLGLETVMMGFGLPDDKIHAPNERFYLRNFYRGIATNIRFFEEYGRLAN